MTTKPQHQQETPAFNKRGFAYLWTLKNEATQVIKSSRADLSSLGWEKHGLTPVNEAFVLWIVFGVNGETQAFLKTLEFDKMPLDMTAADFSIENPLATIALVAESGFLSYKRQIDAVRRYAEAQKHAQKMAALWSIQPSESRRITWHDANANGRLFSATWVYDTYTDKSQVIIDAPSHALDYRNRSYFLTPVVWEKRGRWLPPLE